MPTIDMRLCKGTLTNSSTTLYTVPSATKTIIKALTLCNITASAVTVTISFASVSVIFTYTLLAYDTITIPFFDQIIEATELIQGSASSNSAITYYMSGKQIT
jgi:hypothetical protein